MDPDSLEKLMQAAPAIAKGVGAVAAAVPFTAIVKRMLGPAADEVAEMLKDRVRLYRYGNQLKCIEKAEKMAKDAGFTPQAVPPKILFPLLEGASFEEDESLHDMWAALLANAASSTSSMVVRPVFIAILNHMAADEAGVLKWIYDHLLPGGMAKLSARELSEHLAIPVERIDVCIGALEAAGLIDSRNLYNVSAYTFSLVADFRMVFSPLGREFIKSCHPPIPKDVQNG